MANSHKLVAQADAHAPAVHATSHQTGGSDAVKIDDLAAGDDNTDLNVSTSKHGLAPKITGSDGDVLTKSGTAAVWATGAGGAVATDAIWDAAGDLAVGSGANTAAKLTKGAAGANLSTYNGVVAWNGGTSFPASPTTGDRYWRSDLGLECYYDGTRWLSTTIFTSPFANQVTLDPLSANNSKYTILGGRALWLIEIACATQTAATNDGTHYWTITANTFPSAAGVGSPVNTSADTAGGEYTHTITIGAVVANTEMMVGIAMQKTSTPGAIYVWAEIRYRLILT